jgi:hypothetical protein
MWTGASIIATTERQKHKRAFKHVRPPLLLFESYVNEIKGEEYLVVHQNNTAWLQLVLVHKR